MTHLEFIHAFESCTFPREEWTHTAHIRMAWIYCSQYAVDVALKKAREGIKAYNASVGADPALYHETITTFYILMVQHRANLKIGLSWEEFVEANKDLLSWWPSVIENFYTKELLYSRKAREGFVPPDLSPLPSTIS